MSTDHAARIAAECDELLERLATTEPATPELRVLAIRALARAGVALHLLAEQGATTPAREILRGRLSADISQRRAEPDTAIGRDLTEAAARKHLADGNIQVPFETAVEFTKDQVVGLLQQRDELQREVEQLAAELRDTNAHLADGMAASYRKRWHEAATQRDALVQAAQAVVSARDLQETDDVVTDLRAVVEQVESVSAYAGFAAGVLRRELWAVLDRMPASDDDLIASVRALKRERDDVFAELVEQERALTAARAEREAARGERHRAHGEAETLRVELFESIRQHEKTADTMERARAQRDELLRAARVSANWPKLLQVVDRIEEDRA